MSNVGQIASGVVGGTIGAFLGGPVGAYRGFTIGLMIGGILFPETIKGEDTYDTVGSLSVTSSGYGSTIPVIYGTRRVPGKVIYYGNFTSVAHVTETESGGKGGGGGSTSTSTSYTYTVSLAIGICMGTASVLKIWSGDTEISASAYTVYDGTQTSPDSHIEACLVAEGKTRFPVWKNLCYVVFPNFDLGSSTSLPNFTFEARNSPMYNIIPIMTSDTAPSGTCYASSVGV
jgi:hypothetical protein